MILVPSVGFAQSTSVTWETLGNTSDSYTQRITIKGDMDFQRLAFNMFARPMSPANPMDTIAELVPGYYYIASQRLAQGADSVSIDIVTKGMFIHSSYAPDGFHRVEHDGSTSSVKYTRRPIDRAIQWSGGKTDNMPYGDEIYRQNQNLATDWRPGVYDIIPSFKKVTLTGGESQIPQDLHFEITDNDNPEYYKIVLNNGKLTISANDSVTCRNAFTVLLNNVLAQNGPTYPNVIIEDWPDMPYRGLMVDIVRNYQTPETIIKVLGYMALFRLNKLHFHICDDEAWRLQIQSLPELTRVGARRGYTLDEKDYLVQIYSGDGDPDSDKGVSNGYFTRQDFIHVIRTAHAMGIDVIPEIESPGHARAAIKAMESRYRSTGDDCCRLIHDGDTSAYTSAQAYHDNVMNPALPGPYRFMETVIDEIKSIYEEAGVPLVAIHIGGDEVPHGAWNGSETAKKFIADNNIDGEKGLHAYFVERIAKILADRGIPMSGWQEIAVGHPDRYNARILPQVYSVNCWSTLGEQGSVTDRAVQAGYPIVLSNVDHFYLDQCYNHHPEEPGLYWGGTVDEFSSFHGYPDKLCPTAKNAKGKVIGLSGHVFAETLRSPQMLELYLMPKMLGLAERAWNNDTTYTDAQFNTIIGNKVLPLLSGADVNFHLRQPGITIDDGKIKMNSPYNNIGEIRYTLDASEPTLQSELYTCPIQMHAGIKPSDIRARLFLHGKASLTTRLPENRH